MEKKASRYAQISSIANAEPIGSLLFYTHLGLLLFAALGAYFLFGHLEFVAAYSVYAILLTAEKKCARAAANTGKTSLYPTVLSLLFLRAVAFNVIVLLVWRLDGDVFKMAALALLVTATINIMVFHATYRPVMACVVAPIASSFAAIATLIIMEESWTTASVGAVAVVVCVVPYFGLALSAAQNQWQELSSTKDALDQANRLDAIGQVASGVSHDFNNILGVIAGNLHLLELEHDPNERAALIQSANEAVEGGASLSRQLLTMGKQQALRPEAVSLSALIDTFIVFCRNVFPASIAVDARYTEEDPTVYADPNLLQSALLNVALNAKTAMKDGGTLTLEYGFEKTRSKWKGKLQPKSAFISVSDTGVGMSEETIKKSFEPFFSTKPIGDGSGLGLPMVKGFIEQSNGHIFLSSIEGKGTTVRLCLPVATERSQPTEPTTAPISTAVQKGSFVRILLVEDNRELRRILRLMLERLAYDVVAFESGDEAAGYLSSDPTVHLVLCDFDLPGKLQGDDLLALVKAEYRGMRFILMSGFAPTEKFADTAALSKADLFLPKPIKLADLQVHVEGLLDAP
ncbi:ATP-binding protein [uncultured Tateyamaria sp.]|uniref:ATP-binding protein n=1 Tax=uncultured Tateyamaria sp. TaxID=455651 RepID=UPI0026112FC0|nr:ATP-binding protein [uncultured Tateyamaria sp.]